MEENRSQYLVWSENAAPKRLLIRSEGVFYVLLLIGVFFIITIGNALGAKAGLPVLFIQLALFALLFGLAFWIYRFRLLEFRYVLTDRMLTVDHVVGKKIKNDESVHLSDITGIRAYSGSDGKTRSLYVGRRADALALDVRAGGRTYTILISPTEEFAEKLKKQWKAARK